MADVTTRFKTPFHQRRFLHLLHRALQRFELDLRGYTVLTEVGSDYFMCTPLLAALAGAEVHAICHDSSFGSAKSIFAACGALVKLLGLESHVTWHTTLPLQQLGDVDLVTNLGHVRPIQQPLIHALPRTACLLTMCEAWEVRSTDIDIAAARRRGLRVVATNECHPTLRTFAYLAPLIAKLAFEIDLEIYDSHLLLVASAPFGPAIATGLQGMGAHVTTVAAGNLSAKTALSGFDGVVLSEHNEPDLLISHHKGLNPTTLADLNLPVLYLSGNLDFDAVCEADVMLQPTLPAAVGRMTVTTDYLGPKPVIDLHAAGLKAGELTLKDQTRSPFSALAMEM